MYSVFDTIMEAFRKAQINPDLITKLPDDLDSNGNVIQCFRSREHGDTILIELYCDDFLEIKSEKDGMSFYSDWVTDSDIMEER